MVDEVSSELAAARGGWLCPVNLDVLRQIHASDEIRTLVSHADLMVADGMPLLWASRLAGKPLPERVAGSTLVTTLCAEAARSSAGVYLLGGNPGTADAAGARLVQQLPGLRIVGTHCPPFGFENDDAAMAAMVAAMVEAAPSVVFVGLGFPKQDRLIQELRTHLPAAWFVSCGISFSFVSGEIGRAPRWVQKLGFEWVHRMAQEPQRLFRRYVVDGIPFLAVLGRASLAQRRR